MDGCLIDYQCPKVYKHKLWKRNPIGDGTPFEPGRAEMPWEFDSTPLPPFFTEDWLKW